MKHVYTFNEDAKKREFIDHYFSRGPEDSPDKIMDAIEAPRRMLTEWISDPAFQSELEQIDQERAFMAKEVVYRKIQSIFDRVVDMATGDRSTDSSALRAAELMLKVVGVLRTQGGGSGTSVTINNTLGQEALKGMNLDDLKKQRDELAGLLVQLSQPAEFEEKAP